MSALRMQDFIGVRLIDICAYVSFGECTGGLSTLDCSVMARISDGYTIGAVDSCLKEVLTCKRKLQLRTQPLTHAEIINTLRLLFCSSILIKDLN